MKRALLATTWAVLAALPLGCGKEEPQTAPDAGQAAPALAHLAARKGTVTLERDGAKAPAVGGQPLQARDALETGEDSSAVLNFQGGRSVEMGSNARLVLGGAAGSILVEVERGIVLQRVPGSTGAGPGELSILTPFGMTRIGEQGGELTIRVLKDTAEVDVKVGSVQLLSRDGKPLSTAEAGQHVDLARLGRGPIQLKTLVVTLLPGAGHAEVRPKGAARFRPVGAKPVPLSEGDRVRSPKGPSTLGLEGSETAVTLQPQAEVEWGSAQGSADEESTQLQISKGGVELQLAPGRKSHVQLGDTALDSSIGGHFSVSKDRKGVTLAADVGDARVTQGQLSEALLAGQRLRIENGKATLSPLDMPPPALTLRSRSTVYHSAAHEMLIAWEGGPGDYRVEVARAQDFKQPVLAGAVHAALVKVPVPLKGMLYWRAYKAGEVAPVTEGTARFMPEAPLQDLKRLRNEVPEGADTTTIYYQDKPPAVTFTYKQDPNAARYKVTVYRKDAFEKPVSELFSTSGRTPLEAGVLTEGDYVWSVTPLSASGQPLRGVKMTKLQMVYDNSVPSLVVLAPQNGERAQKRVRASGIAPLGAKLFINDRPVVLDPKHRFDTEVAPVGRPPVVVFRVKHGSGQEVETVRVLKAR